MAISDFSRRRFIDADSSLRTDLCSQLATALRADIVGAPDFHREVLRAIESLRASGHDLWSIDESDDFEVWGPNYESPTGPGIILSFSADDGVGVEWSQQHVHADFALVVRNCLASTGLRELLATRGAIVLERLARGGGQTNWFNCENTRSLDEIEGKLSPGSIVTFYFDNRLAIERFSDDLRVRIEDVIHKTGECVVGRLHQYMVAIDVDLVSGAEDLADFLVDPPIGESESLVWGEFPGRDNDGRNAITVTLPDSDGIVRPHPH